MKQIITNNTKANKQKGEADIYRLKVQKNQRHWTMQQKQPKDN